MASKGTKVSNREKKRMIELYDSLGSYSAVAKKMKRDRTTVAKYIQQHEIATKTAEFAKTVAEATIGKEKESGNKTININI